MIGIDQLHLPDNILIFKPNYISLGASILLELFILYIVRQYTIIEIEDIISNILKEKIK